MSQETRQVTRMLPVALTHDEQRELIQQQYVAEADIEAAGVERKDLGRKLNRRVDDNRKKIAEIKRVIASGRQDREVECEETLDYQAGQVRVHRLDTGELVEERELTQEERLADLGFEERPEAA